MTDGSGGSGGEPEMSDSLKTFGAVMKALRTEGGLTQEEFAPRVRYSVAYIAKIEQGKRYPPKDLVERAGEVLGPMAGRVLEAAARSPTRKAGLASWFRQWAGIEEDAMRSQALNCQATVSLLEQMRGALWSTTELDWFKSTYSGGGGDNCVEVATSPQSIHVRDSKDTQVGQLAFSRPAWSAFTTHVVDAQA